MLPCLSLFFLLLLLLLLTCYEDDFLVPDWRVTWTWRAAALHKRSMDGESRYEKEGGERLCPVVGRARAMSAADKREKRAPVKVEGCLPKLGCSIWIPLCLHTYMHILRGPVASWDGVPCGRASPKLTLCTRHIHLICSTKKNKSTLPTLF
jgi:hypothetical protein